MSKNISGFSLIELMVVVAIVAIVASIAYPQYGRYVQRANRGDGISALQMILDAQERYYSDRRTYTSNLGNLGLANPYITPNLQYSIAAAQCGNLALSQCVELTATAQGKQVDDGTLIANTQGRQVRTQAGIEYSW